MKLDADLIRKLSGDVSLDSSTLDSAEQYCLRLLEENRKINLVSRSGDVASEIQRQFYLSVAVLHMITDEPGSRWLDIGSGGGFPAIPLAILRPDNTFDLVESVSKKSFCLQRIKDRLALTNVHIINDRVEHWLDQSESDTDRRYDYVTIKAVADWPDTFAWAQRVLRKNSVLITYKPPGDLPDLSTMNQSFQLTDTKSIASFLPEVKTQIIMFKKQ